MTNRIKNIVYFDKWVAPCATEILKERTDIQLKRVEFTQPETQVWPVFRDAHGYNCLPRNETPERWWPAPELIARSPNLLVVCSAGAGYDMVNVEACTKAGIIVCNQSGTNQEAVAEHALGLMLAVSKRIGYWNQVLRRTPNTNRFDNMGNDLYGKTLGIVGAGPIGAQLGKLCSGMLAMKVLAYDPYLSAGQIAARGATKVELEELLRNSDFVSLHTPLNKETEGFFGAREFGLMKPTAYFITTARGRVHDENALVDALKNRRIAGAGLDVFHVEPPPIDHPLLAFDNVVATAHMGGITVEALDETAAASARQWMAIFNGKVPPRLVNKEAWPLYSKRFEEVLGFRPDALT